MSSGVGHLVDVPGAKLHAWRERPGGGERVTALVPTGGGIPFYANTFSARLREGLDLVYVEMRGSGASSGSIEGATFASLADDLEAVRAALGLGRVVVLGHSNHGCIALEHALRYPQGTAGVVVAAGSPDYSRAFQTGQERWEREASPAAKERLAQSVAAFEALDKTGMAADEVMLERYLSLGALAWRDPDFDSRHLWGESAPTGMAAYFDWLFTSGSNWSAVPRLGALEAPVLAISGRWDYLCPVELWREAIGAVPRGRLEVLEQSAHNPQYEEAAAFDDAVLAFVDEVMGWRGVVRAPA